jgi:thiol-disulfide isomerase/thioredoxin
MIDFWATWCGPCVHELPHVKGVYEKLHPKGFEIVGISFDEKKSALQGFVLKEKMAWPQYFDGKGWDNRMGSRFGIESIPTMWLVDKKGVLRDIDAREDLEGKVQKLLAE